MKRSVSDESSPLHLSDADVFEAMKRIPGYIDITPADFRSVYRAAYAIAIRRIFETTTVTDIMTAQVFSVPEEMSLAEAASLLAEKQISGAPVTGSQGQVVGVVSEKDFLREMGFVQAPSFMQIANHCLHDKGCMISQLHQKLVSDIMSKPPITGTPRMRIGEISELFAERRINRLPIVDEKMIPVGIVTRTDLAHSLHNIDNGSKP